MTGFRARYAGRVRRLVGPPVPVTVLLLGLVAAASCTDPVSPDSRVANIEKVDADSLTFFYGSVAGVTPRVRLTDEAGNPVAGATVRFGSAGTVLADRNAATARSDANGIAVGPTWTFQYVGEYRMEAVAGGKAVDFLTRVICRPRGTLTVGDVASRTWDTSTCQDPPFCFPACSYSYHDRYVFVVPSNQSVRIDAASMPVGSWVSVLDSAETPLAWGGPESISVTLPAGRYEIKAVFPSSSSYTLRLAADDEAAGCHLAFIVLGGATTRHLASGDCLRKEDAGRYSDSFALALVANQTATIRLSSGEFAVRLVIWPEVSDTLGIGRKTATGTVGQPAEVVHTCSAHWCHVRVVASSRDPGASGRYTLSVH